MGLPHPPYLRAVAGRTLVMWVLARAFLFVFLFLLVVPFDQAVRQPAMGLPALFIWLDRRFYHEILLQKNLGASEAWFWGVSAAIALGLDGLAALILG